MGPGRGTSWWLKRLIGWDSRSDWGRQLNFKSSVFIRVSLNSHTGLLVNYLEVMSGLEQFTICSCKMVGLFLCVFSWTVFCRGLCVYQLFVPPLLHSSSSMLLTVASCLLLPGCGPNEYWFHSSNFLCLLSVKSIQRSEVSSGASSRQMRTRRCPKS